MKKTIALLITIFVSFSLCSCDKIIDWTLDKIAESERYELVVNFDFEKESDFEIIKKRLELFDFRITSKDESTYTLDCPFWITTDFWDVLCSNSHIQLIDKDNNEIINSVDVYSGKCDFLELRLNVSETLYNKCDEELFNNEYYLTDGTNKYKISWLPEQVKDDYVLRLFFPELDPDTMDSADETKALFHYGMSITNPPLEGEVSFTIID